MDPIAPNAQESEGFTIKEMTAPKEPKAQTQKAPREPKAQKAPKEPKAQKEQREPKAQESKKEFVMFLGVLVYLSALQSLFSTEAVQALFAKYPALIQKEEFHATLKFFKKDDKDVKREMVDEFKKFIEEHGADVSLMVTGIGFHQGTCALQVSPTIRTTDGSNTLVPWTHNKQNHISIALEEGKNAKDSVFAVMKQEGSDDYPGDFIPFTEPIPIIGHLQTF
jgi:hypothetical protein